MMRKYQQGMATLFTSIMILVLLTGVLGYLNRGLFIEQKSISNQTWNLQAKQAAEAGIGYFIANIQRDKTVYLDSSNVMLAAQQSAIDGKGNLVFAENKVIGNLTALGRASAFY
ncbi:MAG: pilus assembly PilX N-terminal domain-containing protein, partial [Deefgea sp.]